MPNIIPDYVVTAVEELKAKFNTAYASMSNAIASEAVSEAARDAALGYRNEAEGFSDIAATEATNALSAVSYQNLLAMAQTKAVTAVDVFVYDTSQDSDGGAWRNRCQSKSWYNETLNTATRGSRREFPAVAVYVLTATELTIYDGDDPSLPMWMVFNGVNGIFIGSSGTNNSIDTLNAYFCVGHAGGMAWASFLADEFGRDYVVSTSTNVGKAPVGIAGRNLASNGKFDSNERVLSSVTVNDVAMTVLPNAPIDPATGLQIPTIAVATNGGVSIIKDDGTVVDIVHSSYNTASQVGFTPNGGIFYATDNSFNGRFMHVDHVLPTVDVAKGVGYSGTDSDEMYHTITTADYTGTTIKYDILNHTGGVAIAPDGGVVAGGKSGTNGGLVQIQRNLADLLANLHCVTKFNYTTGWLAPDTKGTWLSDTVAETLVGAELITNGQDWTGASGTTPPTGMSNAGWYETSDGTYSVSAGVLTLTSGASGRVGAYFTISTVIGAQYALQWTGLDGAGAAPSAQIRVTDTINPADTTPANIPHSSNPLDGSSTFTATTSVTYVSFTNYGTTSGDTASIGSLSVRRAVADRSVNNKGLIVNGNITKSAVATGAELMAYSGFSATNYLQQPYNPDLDFGTGDFCVMGWVIGDNNSTQVFFDRGDGSTARIALFLISGVLYYSVAASTTTVSSGYTFPSGKNMIVMRRQSGVLQLFVNGVSVYSIANTANVSGASSTLRLGVSFGGALPSLKSLTLWRIGATAPSPEQIRKIYEDEKHLFSENAACTLYGASDAVTALAHDPVTGLNHAGTSAGRSVFQGLQRVANTTTGVTKSISANNGMVVEQ